MIGMSIAERDADIMRDDISTYCFESWEAFKCFAEFMIGVHNKYMMGFSLPSSICADTRYNGVRLTYINQMIECEPGSYGPSILLKDWRVLHAT